MMVNKRRRGTGEATLGAQGAKATDAWIYEGLNGGGHSMSDCLNDGSPVVPLDKSGHNMTLSWEVGGCSAKGEGLG